MAPRALVRRSSSLFEALPPIESVKTAPLIRCSIIVFAVVALLDVSALLDGLPAAPSLTVLFLVDLGLRVRAHTGRWAGVELWPYLPQTLYATLICEHGAWVYTSAIRYLQGLIWQAPRLLAQSIARLPSLLPGMLKNLLYVIRNPAKLWRMTRDAASAARSAARWAKWAAPVVGIVWRLSHTVHNYRILRRQARERAVKAQAAKALRLAMTDAQEIRNAYATMIQTTYRWKRARRQASRRARWRWLRATHAARIMQRRAAEAAKYKEWRAVPAGVPGPTTTTTAAAAPPPPASGGAADWLKREASAAQLLGRPMSAQPPPPPTTTAAAATTSEAEAPKKPSRPLLLRPDCRFTSYWKLLFLGTLALEMLQVRYASGVGEKLTPAELLHLSLAPQCLPPPPPPPPGPLVRLRLRRPPPPPPPLPEYCSTGVTPTLIVRVLSPLFAAAVAAIAAVDVGVDFFTGVVDPQTGILVPPRPLKRWLLPPRGVAYHVLVSPAMEPAFDLAVRLISRLAAEPPRRLLRIVIWLLPAASLLAPPARRLVRSALRYNPVFRRAASRASFSLGIY